VNSPANPDASERKKSHDKVYPKGYVEMLEHQQNQLVTGLVILYERLVEEGLWKGPPLDLNSEGKPYTHYILQALRVIEVRSDGSSEEFEEDFEKLQATLIAAGAAMTQPSRRRSFSSESDRSQHSHVRTQSRGTPVTSHPAPYFADEWNIGAKSEPVSPPGLSNSPLSNRHSFQAQQPSPSQQSSPLEEDIMFQPPWQQFDPANDAKMVVHEPEDAMPSEYATQQVPGLQQQQHMGGATFGLPWETPGYTSEILHSPYGPAWNDAVVQQPGYSHPGPYAYEELDMLSFVACST
jgi:hypothetical protein